MNFVHIPFYLGSFRENVEIHLLLHPRYAKVHDKKTEREMETRATKMHYANEPNEKKKM